MLTPSAHTHRHTKEYAKYVSRNEMMNETENNAHICQTVGLESMLTRERPFKSGSKLKRRRWSLHSDKRWELLFCTSNTLNPMMTFQQKCQQTNAKFTWGIEISIQSNGMHRFQRSVFFHRHFNCFCPTLFPQTARVLWTKSSFFYFLLSFSCIHNVHIK